MTRSETKFVKWIIDWIVSGKDISEILNENYLQNYLKNVKIIRQKLLMHSTEDEDVRSW